MLLRLALSVLFLTVFIFPVRSGACEICADEYDAALDMAAQQTDDGGVEITLYLKSDNGIAAMLGELSYNAELFLFLGSGSDIMNVTCEDLGGSVRFLLDMNEDSPSECLLATFYFMRIGRGDGDFAVRLDSEVGCVHFCEGGSLNAVNIALPAPLTVNDTVQDDVESAVSLPCMLSLSFESREGEASLIKLEVSAPDRFAAGVRLFAVDIESGESREYYILGISRSDGSFYGRAEIELYKKTAVVITAVGYGRSEMILGEKRIMLMP